MTPLVETLTIVAIALIVGSLVIWALSPKHKKMSPQGEEKEGEGDIVKLEEPKQEEPVQQKPVITVVIAPFIKNYTNGKNSVSYEITNWCIKEKNGKYYSVIKSSKDALFYIKDGTRRYIKPSKVALYTIEELKVLYEVKYE